MPHVKIDDLPLVENFVPGWNGRFIHTQNMTIVDWVIPKGTELPLHSHPNEQVTILLSGEFRLKIGDRTELVRPGHISVVPADTEHSGIALTDCHGVDIFDPAREDYRHWEGLNVA